MKRTIDTKQYHQQSPLEYHQHLILHTRTSYNILSTIRQLDIIIINNYYYYYYIITQSMDGWTIGYNDKSICYMFDDHMHYRYTTLETLEKENGVGWECTGNGVLYTIGMASTNVYMSFLYSKNGPRTKKQLPCSRRRSLQPFQHVRQEGSSQAFQEGCCCSC